MCLRANAWATGDCDRLEQLPQSDQLAMRRMAIAESGAACKLSAAELRKQMQIAWVAAANRALDDNDPH